MKIILNKKTKDHFTIKPIVKPKKPFNSFLLAKIECDKINKKNDSPFKLMPYKCDVCNEYHIGKNKQVLNDLNPEVMNNVEEYKFSYANKTRI